MGPLVPYVISEEFSLVIAFFLGIAFGFILEQAGFSSSKKLVGLFYGYDFTVLRVFFTAGITAMAGVLLMEHYGLLNTDVIYINPAFLNSAILGGIVMGAGFIIGGFCPGTSICALAIGKLDAFIFVIGAIIGVWGFIETFPFIEKIYVANSLGTIQISEFFGISNIGFGIIFAAVAVVTFVFTWIIENKVNKRQNYLPPKIKKKYGTAIVSLFFVFAVVAFLPGRNDIINMRIAEAKRQQKCTFKEIPADKLAFQIVNNYYSLNIIDVRSPDEFSKFHLPMAINIPFHKMMEREFVPIFKQRVRTNVFYADNDTLVRMACLKARYIGKSENVILKETAQDFKRMFYEPIEPPQDATKQVIQLYYYRTKIANQMNDLVDALKNIGAPVKRKEIKIKGGC